MDNDPTKEANARKRLMVLMTRHQRQIFSYIYVLVPHRSDAEDLLQETSLVICEKFNEFKQGTDFVAWACQIAYWRVRYSRQKFARSKVVFDQEIVDVLAQTAGEMADEIDDRHEALGQCLQRLHLRDRELLLRALRARRERRGGSEALGANRANRVQGAGAAAETVARLRHHASGQNGSGMTLSDPDILTLNELCNAVVDGTLSDVQMQALSRWLRDSDDARRFYVRVTGLSASLHHYASEMQTGEPDAAEVPDKSARRWKWVIGLLSIAASIAMLVWISKPKPVTTEPAPVIAATNEPEFVAQLTGGKGYEWGANTASIAPGGRLVKGQRVELNKGLAEITFDSGAQVVLQGPATLLVNSAWSATLSRGTLTASLPPEAMGFSIANPTVEVVDIGTEFTMVADAGGAATEVLVLKGEVEAAPRTQEDQRPIVLREKDARRFATSGVSGVRDSDQKFQALRQPRQLERFVSPIGYAHWSFDEDFGDRFKAETFGLPFSPPDVQLHDATSLTGATHTRGHVNQAMRFDGSVYAQTNFSGISENSPHTVLFWVKVPREANASNAYAMVAWSVNNKQLGTHPIHIGWNRNANEGPWGVLRTDYGGGFALGSTPLRDGKWHHVAVVFIPRDDPANPVECKQYVDGRFDGEGKPSTPGSDIFTASGEHAQTANGTVWLGCRLGTKGALRYERFTGDMDELFIADGALGPPEIVRLMSTNRIDD